MQFSEVIGQSEVIERLKKTVENNRISHAQLFTQESEYGALALALAYCQFISCTQKLNGDSCGQCPSCKKFTKMAHPDLHFIFPVVPRNSKHKHPVSADYIENWREALQTEDFKLNSELWTSYLNVKTSAQPLIREKESENVVSILSKKAFESDYKFIIIWQAEKMNSSFANKVLKELEEPNGKTLFILISSEPQKLLTTIISRCQIVPVDKPNKLELIQFIKNEKSFDDEAANKLYKSSNGDLIRLKKLLNAENENSEFFDKFAEFMRLCYNARTNLSKILAFVDAISKSEKEYQKQFLNYCLYLIRENFMLNIQQQELTYLYGPEYDFSKKFAPFIRETNVFDFYEQIHLATHHIERNVNSKLVFFDMAMQFSMILAKTKKAVFQQ